MSGATLSAAVAATATRLARAGIEDARAEARLLVMEAAGVDRTVLLAHGDTPLALGAAARLEALAARRAERVPMAQVLGRRGFWEYEFRVTADTLTPRPETELLVEAALARCGPAMVPRRVLDLGTGTGCLLLSLIAAWPAAWGLGIDRSGAALAVARANARALGVADRAAFLVADWSDPLAGRFDVVIANPPYVPTGDIAGLEPEVARHEPRLALDGGADGLDPYRVLFPRLRRLLAPGGLGFFEHGAGQGIALANLARDHTLEVEGALRDLAGHDRCLILATRRGDKAAKKRLE